MARYLCRSCGEMHDEGAGCPKVASDCSPAPLMMAAKADDIARLLRAMYENITVDVEWSEDVEEMNINAVKNLLRGSRLLLMDALSVYGFKDYTEALNSLGERMVR